jgi:Pectate lyase superfamily protein
MNALRLSLPLPLLAVLGCAASVGDFGGEIVQPSQGVKVSVEPSAAQVVVGSTYTFRATVTGTTNTAVTWTIDPAAGTVDATGLLHASTTKNTYTLRATSVADTSRYGEAQVILVDPSSIDASNLMPGDRLTTWDPGIPGGIPSFPTPTAADQIISGTTYGNNSTDASAAINAAIQTAGARASAASPQVVYLPAGNYRMGTPILLNRSWVALRGAGPGQTRLIGTGTGQPVIRLGYRNSYGGVINVTATAAKGAQTLTVASASSLRVGDILQIDQQDGPAVSTGDGHFWNGFIWLADGHYEKRQPTSDLHGPGFGGTAWGGSGTWLQIVNWNAQNSGPWRSTLQQIEITAINGNTLTLRDPLHVAFELARVPQVFKTNSIVPTDPLGNRYVGLEDLTVTGGTNDNIELVNVAYSWVRHVESDGELVSGNSLKPGTIGRHVQFFHAYRCVLRDSYIHHARSIVNGGGAYGVAVEDGSSANLIENNITVWLNKPIVMNVSGGGNVIAYNYVDNAMIAGTAWQESAIDGCHQAFSHGDLFEGNWSPNIGSDSTHGSAGFHVFYRNYVTGRNSMPYDIGSGTGLPNQNMRAAGADALSREHTFVANVLMAVDTGAGTYYEANPTSHPSGSPIYRLGDNGNGGAGDNWDAGQALSFTFRNGNWDSVHGAVTWDPGYPDHTLPSSLYLTAKPAFFGANPWPWVDPTATTRVNVLPAKQRYDAGTPNNL